MSPHAPPTRLGMLGTLRSLLGGPGHRGPKTDHFDGERFFNPVGSTGRSFAEVRRWRRTSSPKPWPQWVENRARPAPPARLAPGEIALTFVNHITFLVQFRGLNVLTDPVYSQRVSPFTSIGPKRVRDPGLPFEDLPAIDLVLVTHNHYDHLDMPTLVRLQRTHSPCFVTSLGNKALLESFGLRSVQELDWWQQASVPNAQVTMTPARHWSARSPRNRNSTLWGGFVVEADDRRLFFAGDTGYGAHFREVRDRCGPLDLCLLPIGAYEPRWFMEEQHMNPDDAVRAHLDLGTELSVGTHFGCFRLTDEGIDDPVVDLATARRKYALAPQAFQVLETGETRTFCCVTQPALADTPD
jgi:L-ascorbate metabolism protein UlaG (beta-lactamase superfamily)